MENISTLLRKAEASLAEARAALEQVDETVAAETRSSIENLVKECNRLDSELVLKKTVLIRNLAVVTTEINLCTNQRNESLKDSTGKREAMLGSVAIFTKGCGPRDKDPYRFKAFASSKICADLFWILCEDAIKKTRSFLDTVPARARYASEQAAKLESVFEQIEALAEQVPAKV